MRKIGLGIEMGKELLLVGVILILVGLVVQLKLTPPDSVNIWVGFPIFLMGVIIITCWIVLKKDATPLKDEALKRAKNLVESWEKEFSDYYIDSVVADLEVGVGFPLPKAKCTLKVTMKKEK